MSHFIDNIELKNYLSFNDGVYSQLDNHQDTDSFGLQWNTFRETQIDRQENTNSYDRFFNETGLSFNDFSNKLILEIGSGAGRFSNIILNYTSAKLFSIEPSSAIYANKKNNYLDKFKDRFFLIRASLYDLPFKLNQFDMVICFGVLQHTADIKKTIEVLTENTKKNGLLFLDFYPYNGFWTLLHAKYMLRPITKRINNEKLYKILDQHIDKLIKLYFFLCKYRLYLLTRFIPIADIKNAIPLNLNPKLFREMVMLDTIDMLTPKYDRPQKIKYISKLIQNNNFRIIFAGKIKYKNFKSAIVRAKKV